MRVSDRPAAIARGLSRGTPELGAMPAAEREALIKARVERGEFVQQRLFVGKDTSRTSLIALRDAEGRERLRLRVTPEGAASIEFPDVQGRVQRAPSPEGPRATQ